MSSGKQLEADILSLLSVYVMPMPTKRLMHYCVQSCRHPQAEVLGMLGDMIARDVIKCLPDGTHGAVYVVCK